MAPTFCPSDNQVQAPLAGYTVSRHHQPKGREHVPLNQLPEAQWCFCSHWTCLYLGSSCSPAQARPTCLWSVTSTPFLPGLLSAFYFINKTNPQNPRNSLPSWSLLQISNSFLFHNPSAVVSFLKSSVVIFIFCSEFIGVNSGKVVL